MSRALVAAVLLLVLVRLSWAQSSSMASASRLPSWLDDWSPLRGRGDLPRLPPDIGLGASTLFLPSSRIGVFWNAGNPAGLVDELPDSRSDFEVRFARRSGTFRRPLDPEAATLKQASGFGWKPFSANFALLGRVMLDQERFDPGTRADVGEPYSSNPFTTLDTSSTATRRTRVRIEGAQGVRIGNLSAGLTLGVETFSNETIEAGFARRTRFTIPAGMFGVSYPLGSIRVGGSFAWRQRAETIRLIVIAAGGAAVQLEGLHEVPLIAVPTGAYYRRIEEKTPTAGLTASGSFGGARWVLYGERTWRRDKLFRQEQDDPASDRWDANVWTAGLALQRSLGERLLVTVQGRYVRLTGEGDRALDTLGVVFRGKEQMVTMSGELRTVPNGGPWGFVVAGRIGHEKRDHEDLTNTLISSTSGLTMALNLEAARTLSSKVAASGTVGFGNYAASSRYPAPGVLGSIYRGVILPELDFRSRQARPIQAALALRWHAGAETFLWTVLQADRLNALGNRATPFGPNGSRTTLTGSVGLTLAGPDR